MSPTFEDYETPQEPPRACWSKVRYSSRKLAVTVMHQRQKGRVRGRGRRQRHGTPAFLRVYHCPECNGWHLTSKGGRQ
jgi:hypothetical protein